MDSGRQIGNLGFKGRVTHEDPGPEKGSLGMSRYPFLLQSVCRSMNILFDNTYARLPERFFTKQGPARVPEPKLIRLNLGLAAQALDRHRLAAIC